MPANWAAGFHQKLKAREDREELARRSESDKAGTANRNLTFDVYMGLAVALVGFNWWLWQNGNILIWIFVDASVLGVRLPDPLRRVQTPLEAGQFQFRRS